MGFLLNFAEVHQCFVEAKQKVLQIISGLLNWQFSNKEKKRCFIGKNPAQVPRTD